MAKIIVDFEINVKEALQNITDAKVALAGLREEQKALQKEILKGTATEDMKKRFGELTVEIRELTGVINQNNREIQNQIKSQQAAEGSLESYRAQIKNLKEAYAELSEEERNGTQGKELISKMDSLTNSAKAAEWQLQGVPKGLSKTVAAMSQVNFGAGRAAAGIAQLGNAFKALMANPIVLAIGAVVAVLKKLVDSFKKNDEAMTRLQKAMAPLKAVLSVIEKAFQGIVNVVSKVVEGIGNFASKIVSFIPGMDKYVQAQEDIVTSTDNLEEAEREYAVESAKRQAQISELRKKSTESEKYTYEQRREFLKEAIELEKQEAKDKKVIAEEKLRIAQEEALGEIGYTEMTQEAWDILSDDQKNTLTELQVAVTNTTTEFNNATRRMTSQLNAFYKQEKQQRQERAKAAAQAANERAKNERDALRELEDLTIEAMGSLQDKEEEMTRVSYNRQIEDLKEKIKTEKNLSKKAKEAINAEIVLLEGQLQIKLGEIDKRYTQERLTTMKNLQQKYYQELLQNKPDDIEIQVKLSDMAFEGEIQGLELRNKEIQKLFENANEEEKAAYENELNWNKLIIEQLRKNMSIAEAKIRNEGQLAKDTVKQANEELLHQIEDTKMLGVYHDNEVEKSRIFEEQAKRRLEAAQEEHDRLQSLSQEDIDKLYASQEEYDNALLQSSLKVVEAENAVAEAARNTSLVLQEQQQKAIDNFTAIANAADSVLGSFQSIFESMAETNSEYAKYAKAMAMAQILIKTAVAIVSAIAAATESGASFGVLAPAMIPVFIAELVGIVSGAIASAVSVLKKADVPSKPKFATGGLVEEGLVGGTTSTRTDDSVEARLSVGEFVVKSSSVKSIGVANLNAMNKTGMLPVSTTTPQNTNQFSMEAFRDIMVEAMGEVHPQVSVKEINEMQTRVSVKESLAKY